MASPGGLKTAINIAAEQAAHEAAEEMEAVMKEALRMLRDELRAEIKEVADATQKVASGGASTENRPQVEAKQQPQAPDSQQSGSLLEKMQALEAEQKKILSSLEKLTARCDQQFARMPSAPVTRDEIDKIRGQITTQCSLVRSDLTKTLDKEIQGVRAKPTQQQDVSPIHATKEYVEKQVADLKAELSSIKKVPAASVTRDDLEAVKKATLAEVRMHGDSSKDHADKKFSELQGQLSQIKGEQEAKLTALQGQGQATKDHVEKTIFELKGQASTGSLLTGDIDKQISELQAQVAQIKGERVNVQLSEIRGQLKKLTTQISESKGPSDSVTRTELDKKISELNGSLSKIKIEQEAALSKLQGPGAASQVEKQISDLQAEVSQVTSQRLSEQMSEMRGTVKKLTTQLSELPPTESVTRRDLESIRDATKEHIDKKLSEWQGQSPGAKDQVEKQIADLNAQVSQLKGERVSDQLTEMRGTIKSLMTQLSDKGNGAATIDQVDKQISDLSSQLAQMKGERLGDQLSEMRGTLKNLTMQVADKSRADSVSPSDLEATKKAILSEVRQIVGKETAI